MTASADQKSASRTLHRPKASTVFAAAFLAGAAAAVAVNRAFDVHLAQSVPQVESEPIFVAIRSMPKGSPVNIYDVALKPWPTAMMPATALRADASFENMVLRHPVQEGQPLLSLQLAQVQPESQQQVASSSKISTETVKVNRRSGGTSTPTPAFVPYSTAAPIPASNQQASDTTEDPVVKETEQHVTAKIGPQPATQPASATATLAADNASQAVQDEPTQVRDELTEDASSAEEVEPNQFAAAEAKPVVETTTPVTEMDIETKATPAQIAPQKDIADSGNSIENPVSIQQDEAAPSTDLVTEAVEIKTTPADDGQVAINTEIEGMEELAEASTKTESKPAPTSVTEAGLPPASTAPTPAAAAVEPIDITASVLAQAGSKLASAGAQPSSTLPSSTALLESTPKSPTPAEQQPMRYLVVPERIALQVDHSFTRHSPPPTARPPVASKRQGGVKPLPNATAKTRSTSRPTTAAPQRNSVNRSGPPSQQMQATAGNVPRNNQTATNTSRTTTQQTAKAGQRMVEEAAQQGTRGRIFPNISAGLSAMGQEWRDFRNRSSEPKPAPSSSRQAQRPNTQQPRSASRPQQSR